MAKTAKTIYVCQQCGYQSPKWLGKCTDCGEWNSFAEERPSTIPSDTARGGFKLTQSSPHLYSEIESQNDSRQLSGIQEFDRVLGGGIVPGSLVLIGGDPGIGKSTLLL